MIALSRSPRVPKPKIPPPVRSIHDRLPVDRLPPLDFERFCHAFVTGLEGVVQASRRGTSGDQQGGIDLVVEWADGHRSAFQCKRWKEFGPAAVERVVRETTYQHANDFILLLSCVATVAVRDAVGEHSRWQVWDIDDITAKFLSMPESKARRIAHFFFGVAWSTELFPPQPGFLQPPPELLPSSYDIAGILARFIPSPEIVRELATEYGFYTLQEGTMLEMWLQVLQHCERNERHEKLLADALSYCRASLRPSFRAALSGAWGDHAWVPVLGALWHQREYVERAVSMLYQGNRRLAPQMLQPHIAGRTTLQLGFWALTRVWGKESPVPGGTEIFSEQLDTRAEPLAGLLTAGTQLHWWYGEAEWGDQHLGEALAAEALTRLSEDDPALGERIVEAIVDTLEDLSPPQLSLLHLFVSWWLPGRSKLKRWVGASLERNPAGLSREQRVRILLQLRAAAVLLGEEGPAAAAPAGSNHAHAYGLSSVEWALKSDLDDRVADVLEWLGERDLGTYLELARVVRYSPGRQALLRAARRVFEQGGDLSSIADEVFVRALRASQFDASEADLALMYGDPHARWLWLESMPPMLSRPQIQFLVRFYSQSSGGLRIWARSKLMVQPDLRPVWEALGKRRTTWVEALTTEELSWGTVRELAAALAIERNWVDASPEEVRAHLREMARLDRE